MELKASRLRWCSSNGLGHFINISCSALCRREDTAGNGTQASCLRWMPLRGHRWQRRIERLQVLLAPPAKAATGKKRLRKIKWL